MRRASVLTILASLLLTGCFELPEDEGVKRLKQGYAQAAEISQGELEAKARKVLLRQGRPVKSVDCPPKLSIGTDARLHTVCVVTTRGGSRIHVPVSWRPAGGLTVSWPTRYEK